MLIWGILGLKVVGVFVFVCFIVSLNLRAESLHLFSLWEISVILTVPHLPVLQQENIML